MKKSKINWIIDVLMFLDMMAMGGIGFLIKYSLITGSERWEVYGSNVDLFLWGLDRHQWGFIHLVMGYILLGLLILHILFHWKQIKALFRNFIHQTTARIVITLIFVPISLVLLLFAFICPHEVVPLRSGQGRQALHRIESARPDETETTEKQKAEEPQRTVDTHVESQMQSDRVSQKEEEGEPIHEQESHRESRNIEIFGNMTLAEVARHYDVPADSLKRFLKIPLSISARERLGRLRRRYNFHMSDIERYVEKYIKK